MIAKQEQTALESLQRKEADIQSSLMSLDEAIRGLSDASQEAVSGHELAYTARARAAVQKQKAVTEQDHASCQTQIAAQQERFRAVETERRLFENFANVRARNGRRNESRGQRRGVRSLPGRLEPSLEILSRRVR